MTWSLPLAALQMFANARLLVLAIVLATSALAPNSVRAAGTAADPSRAAVTAVTVSRFTVAGHGSVNTWFIEGTDGLVVIDFQRDVESAEKAIERVSAVGKPVRALLLTHAHPDHIGGVEAFKKAFPDAPLYASQRTADEIRSDSHGYQRLTRQLLGDKAPKTYPMPDRVLGNIDTISVAGLDIEVRDWGASESESSTMFYLPKLAALFSGDVVANRVTDFLLEERTNAWLEQLRALERTYPDATTVHPGHGDTGAFDALVQDSIRYLVDFRSTVLAELERTGRPAPELSPQGARRVAEQIERQFPDRPRVAAIPNLLELNALAVARELMRERPAHPTQPPVR